MSEEKSFTQLVKRLISLVWVLILCVVVSTSLYLGNTLGFFKLKPVERPLLMSFSDLPSAPKSAMTIWQAPDTTMVPETPEGELIRYGKELITHTSVYLGPKGKVQTISNGMNCQNCHLNAGTSPFANNFAKVASSYPKFRNRSGTVVGFEKRINGCFERSMNGKKLQEDSREMKAMVSYLKWIGKDVKKGESLLGFGLLELKPLNRPADPEKGKVIFTQYCARCHGENGQGQPAENGLEWKYPPLYGENSYNIGAGMYRLSTFAKFIKSNMPYGITYQNTFLTDEEAWDVAAYVNSMQRPGKDLSGDWPDISKKPFDYPFGPYADTFPEEQHKYGPYGPIIQVYQ